MVLNICPVVVFIPKFNTYLCDQYLEINYCLLDVLGEY